MAEGHAVVYWAQQLRPIIDKPITGARMARRWEHRVGGLIGQRVTDVTTNGKFLLIHLSGGDTIVCHAMMYGSWQFGEPGMKLTKAEKQVRLQLVTDDFEAVFYNGPVVELLTPDEFSAYDRLHRQGPDIMADDFDRDEAWRRLQAEPEREIGDAIIDQTIVAGVGNIYKSEGLYLAGIDPRRTVADLSREEVEHIWDTLIPIMWDGVRTGGRVYTLPEDLREGKERHYVYQRTGKPCFGCAGRVKMIRQGEHDRSTYFCEACQG